MKGNPKTGDLKRARTRKAVRPAKGRQSAEAAEHSARIAEIRRNYTLQVIATDPEGHEVLNLTKVALERNFPDKAFTAIKIQDVLELLIEAAGEWG
jgi:hypothetical protein